MIPRIKEIKPLDGFQLDVTFDDGYKVIYDVKDDIKSIPSFAILESEYKLFENFQLDESRTCITWSEDVDLPSDTIREYGKAVLD